MYAHSGRDPNHVHVGEGDCDSGNVYSTIEKIIKQSKPMMLVEKLPSPITGKSEQVLAPENGGKEENTSTIRYAITDELSHKIPTDVLKK